MTQSKEMKEDRELTFMLVSLLSIPISLGVMFFLDTNFLHYYLIEHNIVPVVMAITLTTGIGAWLKVMLSMRKSK